MTHVQALRTDLEKLRGRLRLLWLASGLARFVGAAFLAAAVLFALDRWLVLPAGVRVCLLVVSLCAAAWWLSRTLLYPLRRPLGVKDVASAVERRFPEFDGRLLSTLELDGDVLRPERNVSVELVERLREETTGLRERVKIEQIFDYRHLRRFAAAAAVIVAVDAGFAATHPGLTGIFLQRLIGRDVRWPQATFLRIEFPEQGEHFTVEMEGDRPARVKIARGASLPVTVRAQGKAPEDVDIVAESDDGRAPLASLSPTVGGEWVGRFRAVRDAFRFRASGGDDDGRDREVEVSVFTPPTIAAIRTRIEFPAYTGLFPREDARGDVEAPVGASVTVFVKSEAAVTKASAVFDSGLPAIPLQPAGGEWSARFRVEKSCSYLLELIGENGFRNLDNASYAVVAVKDRTPTLRVLEPPRADIDVTPNGLVALRVAADDDYGVAALGLEIRPFNGKQPLPFDLLAGIAGNDPKRKLSFSLVDLGQQKIAFDEAARAPQAGDSLVYLVRASDNHADDQGQPASGVTASDERRIDVVTPNEKTRLLTERQLRIKEDVKQLRDLQQEKLDRMKELLAAFEQTEGDAAPGPEQLNSHEVGQNQVTTRAVKVCRDFAELFQDYCFNRLDPSAGAERVIPLLAERKRASVAVDSFDFGVWRPLVDQNAAGAFGQLDVLSRLLEMLHCVLDVGELHSVAAGKAISEARLALDAAARPAALQRAQTEQQAAIARLDQLLEKMDEWENYQEVVSLMRTLIEDQRELNDRTRKALNPGTGNDGGDR